MYRFCSSLEFFFEFFYLFLCAKFTGNMKQNEKPQIKKKAPKDIDEIDEKIERLQKQNEAETIAFKKLLNGLHKLAKNSKNSTNNN